MPGYCTVLSCFKKYEHSNNISFHKFPLNEPILLKKWTEFTGRDLSKFKPNKFSKICSRHFAAHCFKENKERKNLVDGSFPTIIYNDTDYQSTSATSQTLPQLAATVPEELCRLCGLQNSELDVHVNFSDLEICFPAITFSHDHRLPKTVCLQCDKTLKDFIAFGTRVAEVENHLKDKLINAQISPEVAKGSIRDPEKQTEIPKVVKIKQEPMITVKEEKVDSQWKNTNIISNSLFPSYSESNWPSLFTSTTTSISSSSTFNPTEKRKNDSKTCEILEIVNLSRPLIDITDPNITRILHSQDFNFTPWTIPNTDMVGLKPLKVEYTDSEYDENFEHIWQNLEEEHCYAKRPDTGQQPENLKQETEEVEDVEFVVVESYDNTIVEIDMGRPNNIRRKQNSVHKRSYKFRRSRIYKRCEDCKRTFHNYWSLGNHKKGFCDRLLKFRSKLMAKKQENITQVLLTVTYMPKITENKEEALNKPSFMCSVCGKNLSSKYSLKNHEITHKGTRTHACKMCNKRFATLSNLIQHRVAHSTEQKHHCQQCEKAFKNPSGLKQHINAFHLKLRPHICPLCGRSFAMKYDMTKCKHTKFN